VFTCLPAGKHTEHSVGAGVNKYNFKNMDKSQIFIPTKKTKVCIVEDDAMIAEIYAKALEDGGYAVVAAKDGEEGLAVIKKEKPDVAIVDLIMPKMDGITLIKLLQQDGELAKIPIIVATNRNDEKTIQEVGKLKTKFYLEKALFEPKDIVQHVREVLQNQAG